METNINKIKDERLTEDEKMEIIADYLENGGGGEGGEEGGILLHANMVSLVDASGNTGIYADPDMTTPLTRDELDNLLFGITTEDGDDIIFNKAPKSAWIFTHDSSDAIFKVLGGFYNDMSAGFLVAGLTGTDLAFYRIYNNSSDGDSSFRAERLTSLS